MMSKNMLLFLIFLNKWNDKDMILEKCEIILIGNMKGVSYFIGFVKWVKYLKKFCILMFLKW